MPPATSTANWLAHTTRVTRPAAAGVVRLGYDLGTHDHVRDALAHGDLRLEQARAIIHAIKALPGELDPDLVGVVGRLMEHRPEDRYRDGEEAAEAMRSLAA